MNRSPRIRPGRGAFTLIELLAVLGVMVILFSLTAGLFLRMNAGSSMRSAASSMQTALALARQHAISEGQATYVVALPRDLDFGGIESLRPYAANGYAVYAVTNAAPGSMEGRWLTGWRRLPPRAVLDDDPGRPDSWFQPAARVDGFPLAGDGGGTEVRSLPACGFLPEGRPPLPGGYRVYLVEGTHRVDGGEITITRQVGGLEATLRVNGLTGLTRMAEYRAADPGP